MKKYATVMMSMVLAIQAQMVNADNTAQILEFRKPQVDIFNSTGTEHIKRVDSATIRLPVPVIEVLNSGFFVIEVEGEKRAVRKRAVRSDYVYDMKSKCSNQLQGNKTGTSRGLGDGEC